MKKTSQEKEYKEKFCIVCNKKFKPISGKQITCLNSKCRVKNRQIKKNKYYNSHPEKRARQKKYYNSDKERILKVVRRYYNNNREKILKSFLQKISYGIILKL